MSGRPEAPASPGALAGQIEKSWREALSGEISSPRFAALERFVDAAYSRGGGAPAVFPPREKLFEAFKRTPFNKTKVVILGQDPYHEPGQAQGLAFYVPPSVKPPPSLANIAKEYGRMPDLLAWADGGVLLLNAILTVESGKALSHKGRGWEEFTDAAIAALAEKRENVVFILWGGAARRKGAAIDRSRHCVIESAHPSPLSAYRGFFGSDPFGKARTYLLAHGIEPPF